MLLSDPPFSCSLLLFPPFACLKVTSLECQVAHLMHSSEQMEQEAAALQGRVAGQEAHITGVGRHFTSLIAPHGT